MAEEKKLAVEIEGIRPLLMKNGRLADPEDFFAKQINAINVKKQKDITPEERLERDWLEYQGSVYWSEELGLHIPSDNIERCIQLGAQKSMKGKTVQSCVFCTEPFIKLLYKGPRTVKELYDHVEFAHRVYLLRKAVVIKKSRVFKVRPMIPTGWRLEFELWYDETIIGREELKKALINAGALIGLGDWRPKFGRFKCKFPEK